MLNFPYLTTLVRKNANYQGLFPRVTKWQSNQRFLQQNNYNDVNEETKYINDGGTGQCTKKIFTISNKSVHYRIWDTIKSLDSELQTQTAAHRISTGEENLKKLCLLSCFIEPNRTTDTARMTFLSKGDLLECGYCRKWFGERLQEKLKAYLEGGKHERKGGGNKHKQFCGICAKILSNRNSLGRHMLTHSGEKPFPCDICGRPFRRKDNCARHKRSAHLFKKVRKSRTSRPKVGICD